MLIPMQLEERRKADMSSINEEIGAGLSSVVVGASSVIGFGFDERVTLLLLVVRTAASRTVDMDGRALFLMEARRRLSNLR